MVLPYTDIDSSGVLAMAQMWPMPVVASRVGGFAEQLAACEGAVLFDTGDPAALATALGGIIDPGHLEVLRKGARADVDRLPSWDEAARLTVELYERLLAAR